MTRKNSLLQPVIQKFVAHDDAVTDQHLNDYWQSFEVLLFYISLALRRSDEWVKKNYQSAWEILRIRQNGRELGRECPNVIYRITYFDLITHINEIKYIYSTSVGIKKNIPIHIILDFTSHDGFNHGVLYIKVLLAYRYIWKCINLYLIEGLPSIDLCI